MLFVDWKIKEYAKYALGTELTETSKEGSWKPVIFSIWGKALGSWCECL